MTRDPQKVWLSRADREALREYAWMNRTHMGKVVGQVVSDIRDNPTDVSSLSPTDSRSEIQLSVVVDPGVWSDAKVAAGFASAINPDQVPSFTAQVRRRIRKILIDEGLLK